MIFNSLQRKGVFILLFLITCILVIPSQFISKNHDFFLLQEADGIENTLLSPIRDSSQTPKPIHKTSSANRRILSQTELNTADSIALEAIRGIGPYYASRIIRYRKRLGGYHSIEQLKELKMQYFNIDSSAHFFTVNPALIVKRDLNTMEFKTVLSHPYLEYKDVKRIFNAKREFGTVSYPLLEEKQILPDDILKKIKPYFQ